MVASSFFWTARRMTGREFIRAKASSQTSLLPMSYWVPTGVRRNSFWKGSDLSGRKGALELPLLIQDVFRCQPNKAVSFCLWFAKTSAETQNGAVLGRVGRSVRYSKKTLEGVNPRARGAHIYKGPVENRSGLGRSIITMVQPSESLL